MFDVTQEYALHQERRAQLLREARMQQLYSKADQERSQFGERLMGLVGDLMISGGQKLKARSGGDSVPYTTATVVEAHGS
jgi:hypothetical protein